VVSRGWPWSESNQESGRSCESARSVRDERIKLPSNAQAAAVTILVGNLTAPQKSSGVVSPSEYCVLQAKDTTMYSAVTEELSPAVQKDCTIDGISRSTTFR